MKTFKGLNEDLRKWFDPDHPKGGWKRINSKGEAIGPCAREPGEPKPKCMSNEKRAKLSKDERASAVRAKRKHDPVADRSGKGGKPVNVSNFGKGKLSENMQQLDEKNKPTNPALWSKAKAMARSKFDVYPSAYANGWAAKWYKSKGGGWESVSEETSMEESTKPIRFRDLRTMPADSFKKFHGISKSQFKKKQFKEETDTTEKVEMVESQLHFVKYACEEILDYIKMGGEVEEWYQVKVAKSFSEFESLHAFIEGEKRRKGMVKEETEQIDEVSKELANSYMHSAISDRRKTDEKISKTVDKQQKDGWSSRRHNTISKLMKKTDKRSEGIGRALNRLQKEQQDICPECLQDPCVCNGNHIVEENKQKKDNTPPFEGGHKAKPMAKPGKYGIGYSTARHLARMGMKKAEKLKEQHAEKGRFKPVEPKMVKSQAVVSPRPKSDSANVKLKDKGDNRKASIIRSIVKKSNAANPDKFQKDPELGSTITKDV